MSIIQYTTLKALLVKVVAEGLETDYINMNIVFLNLVLKENIFIKIP